MFPSVAPRQESYGCVLSAPSLLAPRRKLIWACRTFDTQIDDFRDLFTPMPGQWNVDWHSNDTLFIISLGVNDMVGDPSLSSFFRSACYCAGIYCCKSRPIAPLLRALTSSFSGSSTNPTTWSTQHKD